MSFIDLLSVILLGIVEGFTEFLPISSTGHLILFEELIHLNASEEFTNLFIVVIQLGAILAVCLLFFRRMNPFDGRKSEIQKRYTVMLWIKVIVATIPAAFIGFLLDDIIEKYLYNGIVVAITLFIYGIVFLVVENRISGNEVKVDDVYKISYSMALYIGFAQVLALIPGTSRSGATIIAALLFGCSRVAAAEFSFLLSVPIIFGATILKIVKYGFAFTPIEITYLLLGTLVSFILAVYSVKLLLYWIKKHDFNFVGIYRIVLALLVFSCYTIGKVLA